MAAGFGQRSRGGKTQDLKNHLAQGLPIPAHGPTVGFPDQAGKPPKETEMTLYAAIDLHSNNTVLCVLDESDRIVFSKRPRQD